MRGTLNISLRILVRTLPFVLILVGAVYLLTVRQVAAANNSFGSSIASSNTTVAQLDDTDQSVPFRIAISDVGIDLALKKGAYDSATHQWDIDEQSAYLATEAVTSLIYAHNRPGLFANLDDVNEDTIMTLVNDNGTTTRYEYLKTEIISPNDGSVLYTVHPRTVILLTCNGFFDETRRLVYFREQS
jgi:LPXTG-site transpeptidase (sortase) family protein